MRRFSSLLAICTAAVTLLAGCFREERLAQFPEVRETPFRGAFPLAGGEPAGIYYDGSDFKVVAMTAGMLADDIERVTGLRRAPEAVSSLDDIPGGASVVAGTLGKSALIDAIVQQGLLDAGAINGKWESFVVKTVRHPSSGAPMLVIAGSDRRGTAFGLTSLSEAIGVSPWYWWADVTPAHKAALYVQDGTFTQKEPSVQYRGIFINDERFGGWARWAEQTYDAQSGKVGPKTYRQVFELLLRLKANYLWPAMHPGTQAFNSDPENARLADDYAIVMGSSHCEQMLRNNEGEWKAVGTYGDFNYITNRQTMQEYWETRVKTNGAYENTYTLGLRGIHDYPMEGANSTRERVSLMQQAIDDQRAMLSRNIDKPIEEIPQVLCTYEEVLDAYHNGLQVPDDVTLLWSDDKQGYCRNLSNPQEQKRRGGAGIYYHLSYHGDPASWIWLSPLSPAFISTELTKAYTYGARKIWVFNVGDIKPAEKEISFVMELAWDIGRWKPSAAHGYIKSWAEKIFGPSIAGGIGDLMARYYRFQAGGKDSHVWFVDYSEKQVQDRLNEAEMLETEALALAGRVPDHLQDAYFELVSYPVRGAAMLNRYQLLAKRSMVRASCLDSLGAMADANLVEELFKGLNQWTRHYNEEIQEGKWREFFNWQPYHWYRSQKIDPPVATPQVISATAEAPSGRFISTSEVLSEGGAVIESERDTEIPLWIEALTPVQDFSKAPENNVFCYVTLGRQSFEASATPINNVWHAPYIGPMWSQVGWLELKEGKNYLKVTDVKPDARIDRVFIGTWPPFSKDPRLRIPAGRYNKKYSGKDVRIESIQGLGYTDGLMVQPFDTPPFTIEDAPYAEYFLDLTANDSKIEIRTLPTLRVFSGRDARYAVQLGSGAPEVFSIHTDDFSAEWRLNVLRGYSSRSIDLPDSMSGHQKLRVYFLDPGIVLQEILVH